MSSHATISEQIFLDKLAFKTITKVFIALFPVSYFMIARLCNNQQTTNSIKFIFVENILLICRQFY